MISHFDTKYCPLGARSSQIPILCRGFPVGARLQCMWHGLSNACDDILRPSTTLWVFLNRQIHWKYILLWCEYFSMSLMGVWLDETSNTVPLPKVWLWQVTNPLLLLRSSLKIDSFGITHSVELLHVSDLFGAIYTRFEAGRHDFRKRSEPEHVDGS